MAVIDDFVTRYRKEYDFYDQGARLAAQLLDAALQSAGVRGIVTFRAKSPSRLESKIRQRDQTKLYPSVDAIYSDIVDLAGVRVALYFPAERDQVGKLVSDLFVLTEPPKVFPTGTSPSYAKRFSGYWATHYRIRLRESSLNEAQRRYAEALVEIQVASVLMHAWAEVEHDLVYKPIQGRLSDDEYAILDELNGLVMAGEIALERLQKAGEARIATGGRRFGNHYELAAYILDKAGAVLKGPSPDAALGRVDLLFNLLSRLDLATPDHLQPYLNALSGDTERRPLAEQVVDQLLAEDPSRYPIYKELRAAGDLGSQGRRDEERIAAPDIYEAIGYFMSRWIEVEQIIRKIVHKQTGKFEAIMPTLRLLEKLEVADGSVRSELERIRRIRNNLVHGIEVPSAADVREAGQRLDALLPELQRALEARKA